MQSFQSLPIASLPYRRALRYQQEDSTQEPKPGNDDAGSGESGADNPLAQAKLERGEASVDPGDFGAQIGLRHHRAEVEAGRLVLSGRTDSGGDGVSLFGSEVGSRQAARDRMRVEQLFVYSIAARRASRPREHLGAPWEVYVTGAEPDQSKGRTDSFFPLR